MHSSIIPPGGSIPRKKRASSFTLEFSLGSPLRQRQSSPQQTNQWQIHAVQPTHRKGILSPLVLNPAAALYELTLAVFNLKLTDLFDLKTSFFADKKDNIGIKKYMEGLHNEIKKMAEQNPELRKYLSEFLLSKNINAEDFFKP